MDALTNVDFKNLEEIDIFNIDIYRLAGHICIVKNDDNSINLFKIKINTENSVLLYEELEKLNNDFKSNRFLITSLLLCKMRSYIENDKKSLLEYLENNYLLLYGPLAEHFLSIAATCMLNLKKTEEAIKFLDESYGYNPNFTSALILKSMAYLNLKDRGQASEIINIASKINPNSFYVKFGLAKIKQAFWDLDEAIKIYDEILKMCENYEIALFNKGLCLFDNNKFEEALICFEKNSKIDPNNPENFALIGDCLFNLKRYEEAYNSYSIAIKLHQSILPYLNMQSRCMIELNKFKEAINILKKLVNLYPNTSYPYMSLGICYYELNELKQSLKYLNIGEKNISMDKRINDNDIKIIKDKVNEYVKKIAIKQSDLDDTKIDKKHGENSKEDLALIKNHLTKFINNNTKDLLNDNLSNEKKDLKNIENYFSFQEKFLSNGKSESEKLRKEYIALDNFYKGFLNEADKIYSATSVVSSGLIETKAATFFIIDLISKGLGLIPEIGEYFSTTIDTIQSGVLNANLEARSNNLSNFGINQSFFTSLFEYICNQIIIDSIKRDFIIKFEKEEQNDYLSQISDSFEKGIQAVKDIIAKDFTKNQSQYSIFGREVAINLIDKIMENDYLNYDIEEKASKCMELINDYFEIKSKKKKKSKENSDKVETQCCLIF